MKNNFRETHFTIYLKILEKTLMMMPKHVPKVILQFWEKVKTLKFWGADTIGCLWTLYLCFADMVCAIWRCRLAGEDYMAMEDVSLLEKTTEHSFLIELRNMCDTCVTHVWHMCDSLFFWIAFRISFLIECVSANYQNGVEVQKRLIFQYFFRKSS